MHHLSRRVRAPTHLYITFGLFGMIKDLWNEFMFNKDFTRTHARNARLNINIIVDEFPKINKNISKTQNWES